MLCREDHDRNYWAPEAKAEGVFRIMCLGDSMTFGSGGLAQEALPAHLERILNAALYSADIEVLNFGVSGESLYDEWHRFVHHGHRYQPDLLVVLICGNDAELYSVTARHARGESITYAEHTAECWQAGSVHGAHLEPTLADIKTQVDALGIPAVVGFYEIHDSAIRGKVSDTLAAACALQQLAFVDLSAEFIGPNSSISRPHLKVSDADGHPSGEAHRLAARRLARTLKAQSLLPADRTTTEAALHEQLDRNAANMLAAGYRADWVLGRQLQQLETKRGSRAWRRLEAPLEATEVAQTTARLARQLRAQATADYWAAVALKQAERAAQHALCQGQIAERIKLASKAAMTLGNWAEGRVSALTAIGQSTRLAVEKLDAIGARLPRLFDVLERCVTQVDAVSAQLPAPGAAVHRAQTQPLQGPLKGQQAAVQTLHNLLGYLFDLLERHPGLGDGISAPAVGGLGDQIIALHDQISSWVALSEWQPAQEATDPPSLYTQIVITLSAAEQATFPLWVRCNPRAPYGRQRSDMRWVVVDGAPHVYRFDMPAFCLGTVSLEVQGSAHIQQVQVFNRPEDNTPRPLRKVGESNAVWTVGELLLRR